MGSALIVGLIITAVCTVICARVSKAKGKNPTLYIVLGLLLPLIGLIVVLVMADDSKTSNVVNNNVIANSQDSLKMDFPINKWYLDLPFEIVSNKIVVSNDKTKALLTLTMQNIGDKIIRSVYLKFTCFDDTYEKVCENNIIEYAYQDLEVDKNQLFGDKCIIELPSTTTRYVEIDFVKMAFVDGTVLREADVNNKESLWSGEVINDDRFTDTYFQTMFGLNSFQAKYFPIFTETKWLCTCGRTNLNRESCVRCNRTKEQIVNAFTEENISEYSVIAKQKREIKQTEDKKKFLKIATIAVGVVIVIIAINYIATYVKEVRIVKEINSLIDNEQYEQAFDFINNSDLSYDDIELYREKVIPYMQEAHEEVRAKDNLALVLGETEYYITEDTIYSKRLGEDVNLLYSTSDYTQTLRCEWSIYANGYLFFVQSEEYRDNDTFMKSHKYTTKYVDLQSGEIEVLGTADSRGDIIKLENGDVFIGQNFLDFYEGILFDPYTKDKYVGEDAIYEWQLENAIYMN